MRPRGLIYARGRCRNVGDGKLERFAARDGISLGAPASISDLSRLHPRLCFFLPPHNGPRTSVSQKQSYTESSRSFSALRLLSLAYERVRACVDEPVTYHLGNPPIPSSAPGSASIENVRRSSNAITSVNDRTIASFDICHAFLLKLRTKTKCVLADVGVAAPPPHDIDFTLRLRRVSMSVSTRCPRPPEILELRDVAETATDGVRRRMLRNIALFIETPLRVAACIMRGLTNPHCSLRDSQCGR